MGLMERMSQKKNIRYDEGCLAAHALNLIGDRWALLVVRELMFSPKRFQMLRAGLPGITASVLTARLKQLRAVGVIEIEDGDGAGPYELTEIGSALLPVLESLCRWALIAPGHEPSRFISPSALMISMGVNLVWERAVGIEALAGFDFGVEAFEMELRGGELKTRLVKGPEAPFVLGGTGNTLAKAVYGRAPLTDLLRGGVVSLVGDREAAQRFVGLFDLYPDRSKKKQQ